MVAGALDILVWSVSHAFVFPLLEFVDNFFSLFFSVFFSYYFSLSFSLV